MPQARKTTMQPSRADHDEAIRAFSAIRSSCCGRPDQRRGGRLKEALVRDLGALNKVVIAYTQKERISHSDYGEYLRALARWLVDAESVVEV